MVSVNCLLFVPAKEKMLGKISTFSADSYILDLEDSIEKNAKDDALDSIENFLTDNDCCKDFFVRVNKERAFFEINRLKNFNVGFMLPKFEFVSDYSECIEALNGHSVIALIETPLGMVNLKEIAGCEWVTCLAFGAEDYTAKSNMVNTLETIYWHKCQIVMYAKAYEKKVFDTPSFHLNDQSLFEKEVSEAVNLGFDGKLAINPKQIETIKSAFANHDIKKLKEIVEIYENSGNAVCVIDGKVFEKMHIDRMKKILKENGGK